jgi:ABC-2 type transport system ATP-binding protein
MISVDVENISKYFGNYKALDNISLHVEKGSVFGLLGPNGAGKTTLIRILMQIYAPDGGSVWIDGKKLAPEHTQLMGYLPEERGLYKKMTVGEQALFFAQLKGMSRNEAEKELKKWFEKFDILSWWNRKVEELSKGMAQKVQFIITVVHKPRLIVIDEPFSGFDPINVELLKNEILTLKEHATIIFSTHDMNSVEELCDEIALINRSKIILSGRVRAIKEQFKANLYAISFSYEGNPQELMPKGIEIRKLGDNDSYWDCVVYAPEDVLVKQLLSNILQEGKLISFKEVLPSFHAIFVSKVTGIPINEIVSYEKN